MAKYRYVYTQTHDIDWFFQAEGTVYHVASNGTPIPKDIDKVINEQLCEYFSRMPEKPLPYSIPSSAVEEFQRCVKRLKIFNNGSNLRELHEEFCKSYINLHKDLFSDVYRDSLDQLLESNPAYCVFFYSFVQKARWGMISLDSRLEKDGEVYYVVMAEIDEKKRLSTDMSNNPLNDVLNGGRYKIPELPNLLQKIRK